MGDLRKNIGDRLRLQREELGLTQGDIAEKLGVAVTTIHRIETAAVTPSVETLIDYCREIGTSVDSIVSDQPFEPVVIKPTLQDVFREIEKAIKVSENSFIQRILQCSEEERNELSKRLDMIEHRRNSSKQMKKLSKG